MCEFHESTCNGFGDIWWTYNAIYFSSIDLYQYDCRPVHPPYSSVFVTEFDPEYGNTDLLVWLRKRSSPKYGNAHHLNMETLIT